MTKSKLKFEHKDVILIASVCSQLGSLLKAHIIKPDDVDEDDKPFVNFGIMNNDALDYIHFDYYNKLLIIFWKKDQHDIKMRILIEKICSVHDLELK